MSDLQVHLVHSFHQLHITIKASPSSLIPHLNTLNAPPTSYHNPLYHKISSPSLPIHFNAHPFCYYSTCHCNLYNSVFFINSSPEHPSNYLDIIHPEVL